MQLARAEGTRVEEEGADRTQGNAPASRGHRRTPLPQSPRFNARTPQPAPDKGSLDDELLTGLDEQNRLMELIMQESFRSKQDTHPGNPCATSKPTYKLPISPPFAGITS